MRFLLWILAAVFAFIALISGEGYILSIRKLSDFKWFMASWFCVVLALAPFPY